jgi:hypothetical protein
VPVRKTVSRDPATSTKAAKPPAETIEARLTRKAAAADAKAFDDTSLRKLTREARRKLLFG